MPIVATFSLITSSVLAVAHILALELYLYWHYPWFDLVTHFLGGVTIALLWQWFCLVCDSGQVIGKDILVTLGVVLVVAVGWEVFELAIGRPVLEDFWTDTILDLVLGLGGGAVVLLGKCVRNTYKRI